MERQSLGTQNRAEAKRRLREREAQRVNGVLLTPSIATWDTAASDLANYYSAYGTRNVREAEYKLRTLTRYFGGRRLADIDTTMVMGYVAQRRAEEKAAATINVEIATLKRALRLAHEYGRLERVPPIKLLRPAPPRAGFFEAERFEAVASPLPRDLELVVRVGYTYGWHIDSEVLTLTRRQADLDAATLRLDPGTTKNHDGRLVYLTPELRQGITEQLKRVAELERMTGKVTRGCFPTYTGSSRGDA
jgi:integrase